MLKEALMRALWLLAILLLAGCGPELHHSSDSTPPLVQITSHTDGAVISGSPVTMSYWVADNQSRITLVRVTVNGAPILTFNPDSSNYHGSFSFTPTGSGFYTVSIGGESSGGPEILDYTFFYDETL
jgi:hypothetical protein